MIEIGPNLKEVLEATFAAITIIAFFYFISKG